MREMLCSDVAINRYRFSAIQTYAFILLSLFSLVSRAGFCDNAWHVDKVVAAIGGRPSYLRVPLRDKQQRVHEVTVDQIQAFHEANERVSRAAGLSPSFVICDGNSPNAFATGNQNGEIVGVTVGMLRMVDGDRDMAAAVLGHELAHHTKRHRENATARDAIIGLAGVLLGIAVDARSQRRSGVSTGLGVNLGQIGANLVSRKFDRDQEREADDAGFEYLIAAGFNPLGAVRLSERMNQLGGGVGPFFDSHPGWIERNERFRSMIARNVQAQQLVAKSSLVIASPSAKVSQVPVAPEDLVLDPNFTISDAQRSYEQALAAFRAKDISAGVREMRIASAAGYAPAQVIVGILYARGQAGLPNDEAEAVRLYRLAAEQGDSLGQANLGIMYLLGRGGLSKDEIEAEKLYRLSSDQGNGTGQAFLGGMYAFGRGGLTRDDVEAVRLFRLSAEQGNSQGQANLAGMYISGRGGLEKNEIEAVKFLRLSADQGNPTGQAILGIAHAEGRGGLPKDEAAAVRLLRLASIQGNAAGQVKLGYMYENGLGGLPKSISDAVSLYQKAAEQGNVIALSNLKRLGRM